MLCTTRTSYNQENIVINNKNKKKKLKQYCKEIFEYHRKKRASGQNSYLMAFKNPQQETCYHQNAMALHIHLADAPCNKKKGPLL